MENVFKTLEKIQRTPSTNDKQLFLRAGESTELKTLLKVAYNPFLQFYIKKIPAPVESSIKSYKENYSEFLNLLVALSKRTITGNLAISKVAEFLGHCGDLERKWYAGILQKDLKIGLAYKGINKVFPKLVPTYEVMLAEKIPSEDLNLNTAKALKLLPQEMVCQYKIDGYRLNIYRPTKNEVVIRTRNGKIVSGYKNLEESARRLPEGYVYDGEIVDPKLFDWIKSNSENGLNTVNRDLFSSVMRHAFSKEENKEGIFNVFDVVKLDDWQKCAKTEPYVARLVTLTKIFSKCGNLNDIVLVPTSRIYNKSSKADLEEIVETFHNVLSIGWEGLMIKDANAPYMWKRTKALLKMKLMDTIDLTVTDVYEGIGKYTGMLGGVYVNYKGKPLGVGSGFNEQQRRDFWDNPNEILGKTIEIAYQAISHNKLGEESVSFPVFKGIREDK